MHTKKGKTKNFFTHLLIFAIGLTTGTGIPHAHAQTVLSPTPFIPLQDRTNSARGIPVVAEVISEEAADQAAEEKLFHIPIIFNESVENQIQYFTTRGRAVFQHWLDRSARYLPIMKTIFKEYNLPEDLVYIAMIESGFNPHAVSPKNAVGCWQFMKATGREYGLNTNPWVDERKDPIKSTRAAAAHLKDLYNTFGSWIMALASYNAGTGTMQGAVLKARSADFWELRASRFIRIETQDYVPRYMAAMIIAKNPVAYGFSAPVTKPFEYDEIIVQKSTDLRRIAANIGSSFKEIQELNPELLQSTTPQSRYVLRIPVGTRQTYQQHITRASARERKHQKERDEARLGGLLFSRLASAHAESPEGATSPLRMEFGITNQLPIAGAMSTLTPSPSQAFSGMNGRNSRILR